MKFDIYNFFKLSNLRSLCKQNVQTSLVFRHLRAKKNPRHLCKQNATIYDRNFFAFLIANHKLAQRYDYLTGWGQKFQRLFFE